MDNKRKSTTTKSKIQTRRLCDEIRNLAKEVRPQSNSRKKTGESQNICMIKEGLDKINGKRNEGQNLAVNERNEKQACEMETKLITRILRGKKSRTWVY